MAQEAPDGGRFGLSPSQQRLAVIAAGAVVVLLLVFLLVLPSLSGGGGGTSAQPPLVRPRVTTTTFAPPAPSPLPSGSFEQFQGKNPFTPLANPASPTGGGTSPTTPAGGGGTTGGGTGVATATTVVPGASGGAATAPRPSQRVALINVYTKNGKTVADVRVNDTVYTAIAPGQTFATNFQLVSLQGQCGTFLFGDERFQLCKGEEVLK